MKALRTLVVLAGQLTGLAAFSQDCQQYFFLQKNKTIEMTIYNKKGEPNGKQVYQVTDVTTAGGATSGAIASEMFDRKGKSIAKSNSAIKCTGGVMMLDMKLMLPQQQSEQFSKADAKVDNVYIEYPAGMKAGDVLKDGTLEAQMNNNGLQQTLTMVVSDRKVEGQESVTTPAGTWNCFKISYKAKITVKTGPIGIPFNIEGEEWYAPGFGVVKTQSKYGSTAITSIR